MRSDLAVLASASREAGYSFSALAAAARKFHHRAGRQAGEIEGMMYQITRQDDLDDFFEQIERADS